MNACMKSVNFATFGVSLPGGNPGCPGLAPPTTGWH